MAERDLMPPGAGNPDIATALVIFEDTVKSHVKHTGGVQRSRAACASRRSARTGLEGAGHFVDEADSACVPCRPARK